jgi:hypothetical protein
MKYLNLIRKKAFGPIWTILSIVMNSLALLATAVWGAMLPEQYIAWAILAVVPIIMVFRLLVLAPYQLWAEDQTKLEALEKREVDPLKSQRKSLEAAASGLLTSATAIYHEWSVLDEQQRKHLTRRYSRNRVRLTDVADRFLHEDDTYRAAQDAKNRCDIVMSEARDGRLDMKDLLEARGTTKLLLRLLSAGYGKQLNTLP